MATAMAPRMQTTNRLPSFRAREEESLLGQTNVGDTERWLSVAGGAALAVFGLSRGSLAGLGLAALGGCLVYRGASGHCSMYQALGMNTADHHGPATSVGAGHGVRVEHAFTIQRAPGEVFRFWRNFANLPSFMKGLERVEAAGGNRWRWVAVGPLGIRFEWEAEIYNERPNELIAWRSLEGSEIDTAGSVHFTPAPGGRGTEVRVNLKYDPPAGKMGAGIARLFGEAPEQQIKEDMRCFKQLMETGELPTTRGQASCRGRD